MNVKGKGKNIQIPLELFKNIIKFMERCNTTDCTPEFQQLYRIIYSALIDKQDSMDLREAYARVVYAEDEGERKDALTTYLELKEVSKT